ncbi:zinc-dependent metalloprotease [Aestuariibacter sp. AA17]|uniref:Zinc-dependent metalloprotease n=1 Tax=Fluctibacter corallii TaxID=2984329 RepID=A0ABT3A7F3_9ALTE|nr:zinc-dependent metalloprotease [Aestuariibacter sp. AA17]MCV2884540.1 zinc-dependent metalloprotease [Aestuariibacter sp. AA17]
MRILALSVFVLWSMWMPRFAVADVPSVADFTQHMLAKEGFYTLYYDEQTDKVYVDIDTLSEPFLFQSSLPFGVGSNDIGLDRGQLGDTRLVSFERFGNKVLLKQHNTQYRASSSNAAEKASVNEAFADAVIAGFTIVAKDDDSVVIDYTPFLLSDIHGISNRLSDTEQGHFSLAPSLSGVYLPRLKSFPDNTELEALVTFSGKDAGEYVIQAAATSSHISVHLHHSFIRLPDDDYQPRVFHPYSGFWKVSHMDYSAPITEDMEQRFIPRHRLVKQDPHAEVSEAVKPIVYYLDPGIPEPVKSALKEGALWWNDAFRQIGYKNAFQVKTLPEDADPMDVRYNVIQWVHRATRGWSYGSSVIDPRTGEIIKGHVTLGSLRVRQDYLIALGLTSPFNTKDADTSAQLNMALARIKQLSAHEVGHTLGIAHNFAASENNRASVMDYPHPQLSVKNGAIELSEAYDAGIGEWDKHVIAYGYQDFAPEVNEQLALMKQVMKAKNVGLRYQSDADARPKFAANPSGHLWDNGADPIAGFENIVNVRQTALSSFGLASQPEGEALSSLQERLVPIYYLHRYQLEAVAKLIGGVAYEYEMKQRSTEPKGAEPVPVEIQSAALDAMLATLNEAFLTVPTQIESLIVPKVYGDALNRESFKGRMGMVFDPISAAESSAHYTLSLLMVPERLNRVARQSSSQLEFILSRLFTLIDNNIEQDDSQLQHRIAYVILNELVVSLNKKALAPEVKGVILSTLQQFRQASEKKEGVHYQSIKQYLDWYFTTGEWKLHLDVKPLPPGSPI